MQFQYRYLLPGYINMLFLAWFKCPDKTGKKSADVGEQYLDLIQYRGPDGSPTLKSADQFTGVWLCN